MDGLITGITWSYYLTNIVKGDDISVLVTSVVLRLYSRDALSTGPFSALTAIVIGNGNMAGGTYNDTTSNITPSISVNAGDQLIIVLTHTVYWYDDYRGARNATVSGYVTGCILIE